MKWFRILAVTLSSLVLVVMLVGCAGPETVTFPDNNLEAAIRNAISKPEGPILATDLEGLTSLEVENMGITDLTGSEHCTNLTNLTLNENQISDLSPLSFLTNLTLLFLGGNQIRDISALAGLTNLQILDLHENNISDISSLAGLTNLQYLGLWVNNISDISPLAGLTNLQSLNLSSNSTSEISPLVENSGLSAGDEVDLSGNPLSTTSVNVYIPQLKQRGVDVRY